MIDLKITKEAYENLKKLKKLTNKNSIEDAIKEAVNMFKSVNDTINNPNTFKVNTNIPEVEEVPVDQDNHESDVWTQETINNEIDKSEKKADKEEKKSFKKKKIYE